MIWFAVLTCESIPFRKVRALSGGKQGPIIIVGAGRTGTTVFHRMLAEHPHLAWLNRRISSRFPERLELSRLVIKGLDYPVLGELLKRRIKLGERAIHSGSTIVKASADLTRTFWQLM